MPHTLSITAGPTGTPNPVLVGGTVALSVTATDALAHAVSYAWTSSCPGAPNNGAFSNAAVQNPTWTPPVITPGTAGSCTIAVTASDGQGLTDTKSYTQTINAPSSHTLTIQQPPKGTPNPSALGQTVASRWAWWIPSPTR